MTKPPRTTKPARGLSKPRSELCQIDTGLEGHTCAFEFVPNKHRPREIYVTFDGQRIAYRAPDGSGRWLSLVPGYSVVDETPDGLVVYFDDERLH